jgi:DNA adenine methylase
MKIMPKIIKLLPYHRHYVSVFGGSATDILAKPRSSEESFNELDPLIYNLFDVALNGQSEELGRLVEQVPNRSQFVFDQALRILHTPISDPVISAWAFLVATHQGFCRTHPTLMEERDWKYNRQARGYRSRWSELPHTTALVKRRFRQVRRSKLDWSEAIGRWDSPHTLFFMDPPYHPDAINGQFYPHELTAKQHEQMLATIRRVKGHVIVCGYHVPPYDKMLADWPYREFRTHTVIPNGKTEPRTEVVWMNYRI